ncbi:hypothetical protein KGQ64_11885 [bacterium]|nr:hypothetical protein [bacterium]
MPSGMRVSGFAFSWLLLLFAQAGAAGPERPLFERSGSGAGGLSARLQAGPQALALDRGALSALRDRTEAALDGFPLGTSESATLDVVRFEPFRADAKAVVMGPSGEAEIPLPDARYFRGRVVGDPESIVLLVADSDTARGFVATRGTVYRFGRDRLGTHRVWDLRDADLAKHPRPADFCGNTDPAVAARMVVPGTRILDPRAVPTSARKAPAEGMAAPAYSPVLSADVAIDTDQEFLALLGGTVSATSYLADLAAAVSAIYLADTDVSIRFSYVRLWETTDPWTANNPGSLLDQLQAYWAANGGSIVRDTVHLVSGRSPSTYGGIAYVNALCDADYGYGLSSVYGSFDVLNPSDVWDVLVVSHELGHSFGSVHTHCYDPPVDQCYSGEGAGCYSGPESLPPGGGTIMSYCDLLPGGTSNVNLTFGPEVSAVVRAGAEGSACITTPCGNGVVDPGEDCDDGNTTSGDCCSSTCTFEPDGNACDDGEACTTSDVCASGACAGSAVIDGTPCDDGSGCTADACASGSCVGTPLPAPSCKTPVDAGKAQLILLDKSPDRGDKMSFKWTKGSATTFPEFGSPDVGNDYDVCIYGPSNTLILGRKAPAGGSCNGKACWKKADGKGYTYIDKLRDPDGIDKLQLVAGTAGRAKLQVSGKDVNLQMPSLSGVTLPIVVQLRSEDGGCWGASFSVAQKKDANQLKAKSD